MTPRQDLTPLSLVTTGLSGARGERVLFTDLSFGVGSGEALVLRGPNGTGKTSLLMMLYGAIKPLSGRIEWQGHDPESGPFIHLFGHHSAVRPRLSVLETLAFWARVNGGDGLCEIALKTVGLGEISGLDAGYLSAGQTRRLALARLLVAPRSVWLLDEPTAALDNEGDRLVGTLMTQHLARGGLIVAATHLPLDFAGTRTELRLGA